MNKTEIPTDIEAFVDKLIAEKQLPELAPEIIAQMKIDLLSRVEDRINAALIAHMSPEQLTKFNTLLDTNQETETQQFLKEAIPDLETVLATALINFRATYLGTNA